MNELHDRIVECLPLVQNPAQYAGGEWNMCRKAHEPGMLRFLFAFPDTYAVGMSHVGLQILYDVLNRLPDVYCERTFHPWTDMEKMLRERELPLFSLETFTPMRDFDVVGFSLQYELCYTSVLNMLDLGGIPLRSADRTVDDPLVIAGGPGALNPEPLADFIDLFVIGDGEETIGLLMDRLARNRRNGSRTDLLKDLACSSESFYVPSLYEVTYHDDGLLKAIAPRVGEVPFPIRAAVVADLDNASFPRAPIVPNTEVVHDRIAIEIMRGCPHRCRFCQAGPTRSPLRFRSVETIIDLAECSYAATGCDEISLLSLSSNNYPQLDRLLAKLDARFRPVGVSISVPSLRVSDNLEQLPKYLGAVRKSGLTYAPEAAVQELCEILGKNIRISDLLDGVRSAYRTGWDLVKLYFMVGLPGESSSDVDAIARLCRRVSSIRKEIDKSAGKVNVTVASFIPKPHTPFQWEPMADPDSLCRIREQLRSALRDRRIQLKFHDVRRSFLEGVFSRGDRRLGPVIEYAWRAGARLDAWDEHFHPEIWEEAFRSHQVDPSFYACRPREANEVLPWSHIMVGIPVERLAQQREEARLLAAKHMAASTSGESS